MSGIIEQLKGNERFHIRPVDGSLIESVNGFNSPTILTTMPWVKTRHGYGLKFSHKNGERLDYGDVLGVEYTQALTWTFLVNFSSTSTGTQGLLSKRDQNSPFSGHMLRPKDGKIEYILRGTDQAKLIQLTSVNDYPTEREIVVTVTYDGSGKAAGMKMRWDGINQTFTTNSDTFDNTSILNTNSYFLAHDGVTASAILDGALIEFIEYDKALSEDEARQLETHLLTQPHFDGLAKTNFQIPELYGADENLGAELLADGDMEDIGVTDWDLIGSATASKVAGARTGGAGTQILRVDRGTGPASVRQSILTTGKTFRTTGWMRGDGVLGRPTVLLGTNTIVAGTISTDWQFFDEVADATGGVSYQLGVLGGDNQFCEFVDVSVKEVQTVGAWNMKLNDGVVADVSEGGNDLVQVNSMTSVPGVAGESIGFETDGGYLRAAVSDYRSGDSSGSIEGWFKVDPSGAIKTLFMSADEASTNYYFAFFIDALEQITIQKKNNDTIHRVVGNTVIPPDQWIYGRLTSDGSAYTLHLNNTEDTPYTVTTSNSGDWFDSVTLRDNAVFGNYLRSSPALGYNGCIDGFQISSQVQTDAEYEKRYLVGARKLTYFNDFSDAPVTLETSEVDLGGFIRESGTWKISQDSTKQKWLECVTAGIAYIGSPQAYGTYEFDLYKEGDGNTMNIIFVSSDIDGITGTNQTGYVLALSAAERVVLQESLGGSVANLSFTDVSYIAIQTKYTIRVTRSPAGSFTQYIKGGAFTNWTQIVMAGGTPGTNPLTDTTNTTSRYFLLDFDAGDKISNIRFRLGDVTPNQVG